VNPEPLAPAPTASPARAGALQRTFSFPAAIAALLAVLGVLTVRGRFDDPDMWWHLKLGEVTWTSHRIPAADLFSYTTNHHSRIAQEWLSQLLIYAAFNAGGYSGLMVWLCLFTAAILIAGYALCSVYSGNAKVAFVGALTIWVFGTSGFAVRRRWSVTCLLILELLVLQLGRSRSPRWYLALPPSLRFGPTATALSFLAWWWPHWFCSVPIGVFSPACSWPRAGTPRGPENAGHGARSLPVGSLSEPRAAVKRATRIPAGHAVVNQRAPVRIRRTLQLRWGSDRLPTGRERAPWPAFSGRAASSARPRAGRTENSNRNEQNQCGHHQAKKERAVAVGPKRKEWGRARYQRGLRLRPNWRTSNSRIRSR